MIKEVIRMNKRGLKTRTPISSTANKELWQQLKDYSDESCIPISKLIDKAIYLLLESTK